MSQKYQLNQEHLRKQLEIIGVESLTYLRQVISEENKIATGELLRSLDFKIIKDMDNLMLKIVAAKQFKWVDQGRRPHGKMPPIEPIKAWIQHKGIPFKNLNSTAFLISRGIAENGIKPLKLKEKMIENIIKKKKDLIKFGATQDIQAMIDKIFVSAK